MTPFDFLNEINYGKNNLMADDIDHQVEKKYLPFIVNKGLSYTMDTVCLLYTSPSPRDRG